MFHKVFGINSSYVPTVHKTVEFSDGGFEFYYAIKLKYFTHT